MSSSGHSQYKSDCFRDPHDAYAWQEALEGTCHFGTLYIAPSDVQLSAL